MYYGYDLALQTIKLKRGHEGLFKRQILRELTQETTTARFHIYDGILYAYCNGCFLLLHATTAVAIAAALVLLH